QPSGISKDRIENLLDAVNKEEKKVQDKVNKEKIKTAPVQTEKDW
ncbi:MAG: BatC protein, partial [Flavobacterium sp.]|nr:BatC protein [Flavobacterium sp.]